MGGVVERNIARRLFLGQDQKENKGPLDHWAPTWGAGELMGEERGYGQLCNSLMVLLTVWRLKKKERDAFTASAMFPVLQGNTSNLSQSSLWGRGRGGAKEHGWWGPQEGGTQGSQGQV